MCELDYHDYKGLTVSEARAKADKEFDKYLERKTDKKNLALRAGIMFLICLVLISMIMDLFLCIMSVKAGNNNSSSVSDLGLDAANSTYVVDKVNVLNDKVKQQAYNLNKKLEKSDYHAQIMVVIVPSVPSEYSTINEYSMAIAEKYKPGDKKQDTGLLYTVAINDHKARLEVGYGLEGKIPDATAAKLQQPANAHYKKQEYSAGVSALLDGVQQLLLDGKPIDKIAVTPSHETDKNSFVYPKWLAPLTLIGGFAIALTLLSMFLIPFAPIMAIMLFIEFGKELVQDVKEYYSRIKEPSKWVARDQKDRERTIETAVDMVLHPESYRDSSSSGSSSSGGGWSSSSSDWSSSSSSSSGGGSFGGGGATTSW